MVGCDIHSDTFLVKISRNPLVFNVTENMLFSLNKSSTHRLPLQNAMRVQVIFLRSGIINFWLLVYGLSQFLARGNSCRQIFGSWWLVVVVVINVLARGGFWWLVVASGGSWWLVVAGVLF